MKFLMAANWKMFKSRQQAVQTIQALAPLLTHMPDSREVAIFAPFTALGACADAMTGISHINLGAQDVYPALDGAFTGEISPVMLKDCCCRFVLTGHSERRAILGESDDFVGKKTAFSLEQGLDVVLCIGETLQERDKGLLRSVLFRQLEAGLAVVADDIAPERLSVAYEPVWAIGTGRVAGPEEISEAHALVREFVLKRFSRQGAEIRILYGGSVKADNAASILQIANVNGVLVGGASLEAESFSRIVLA